jgi:ABC-type multidrug transport system fused ATPase/permease subunit
MSNVTAAGWPLARLSEAIEVLARRAQLRPDTTAPVTESAFLDAPMAAEIDSRVERICASLGIEAEAVEITGAEFGRFLRAAAPAVLPYRSGSKAGVFLLLGASRCSLRLIDTRLRVTRWPMARVRAVLTGEIELPIKAEVERLLSDAGLSAKQQSTLANGLVQQRTESRRLSGFCLLRMPTTRPFAAQILRARLPRRFLLALGAFGMLYFVEIAGWTLIGRGALDGRLNFGWFAAWTLLLFLAAPFRVCGAWLEGTFALDFAALLKQRLLNGAMRMNIDEARRRGAGELLSQVIESQAFESLSLNGGFSVLSASLELSVAGWVLLLGTGGGLHLAYLLLWTVGALLLCWHYYRRQRRWTRARLALTNDLVEHMVGHRTRLVQEARDRRHEDEDAMLERYCENSKLFDAAFRWLAGGVARGWLVLGLVGLAPLVVDRHVNSTSLAIALGGILLAYRAFEQMVVGVSFLSRATVAWEQVADLFEAGCAGGECIARSSGAAQSAAQGTSSGSPDVLLQARKLVFAYDDYPEPLVNNLELNIYRGDRILLEGTSGGGKSTLAALLTGLRRPRSGLLLMNGLDPASLGDSWRQQSVAAPQFHENHVLTGTLAFNLLMGRRWPPTDSDLREAEELCHELGLGDLLSRMPSGLMQMVGESGWQLSHGERSRLYLARALLQKSALVVLDECFAALDPETLELCLRCTLKRAPTLMVIAHP